MHHDSDLSNTVFVAFDTETTGLGPRVHRLVEIAGVKFTLGGGVLDTFQTLIDPGMPIPPSVIRIHGITDAAVRGQPDAATALAAFSVFLEGPHTVLLAHNAPFDLGFLRAECARGALPMLPNPVWDTLSLARRYLPGLRNHQLGTVAAHLRVPPPLHRHRALHDSLLVHGIVTELLAALPPDRAVDEVRRARQPRRAPIPEESTRSPASPGGAPARPRRTTFRERIGWYRVARIR